jgi:hypothetical protein
VIADENFNDRGLRTEASGASIRISFQLISFGTVVITIVVGG